MSTVGRTAVGIALLLLGASLLLTFASGAGVARPIPATATISTALSATSIPAGGSVYDTANLSGYVNGTGVTAGTVSYFLYPGSLTCASTAPTLIGTVSVASGGTVPDSPTHAFPAAGSDSWRADYSGNSANNATQSACEPMTVNASTPTVATNLSATTIPTGGSVHDSATLSGATPSASGTVTYELFTGSLCSGTPGIVSVETVLAGVVPNSSAHVFPSPGAYSWTAGYGGDANNSAATSACEPMSVVPPAATNLTTLLRTDPLPVGQPDTDTATLTGATASAGGSIDFYLFSTAGCTGPANPISTSSVHGPGSYVSSSHSFLSAGLYSWNATYSGDGSNAPATSPCEPLTVNRTAPTLTTSLAATPGASLGTKLPTTGGAAACGIAYDPSDGDLYAALLSANDVQVENGATNTTVTTVAVGSEPCAVAYDANTQQIFVANYNFGNPGTVSVITGTSVSATVPVGNGPYGLAVDTTTDEIYVANQQSNYVSVVCDGGTPCGGSAQTDKVVGTVPLGTNVEPDWGAIVVDPANGKVYVPVDDPFGVVPGCGSSVCTEVISGTSVTAAFPNGVFGDASGAVYDPANGDLYFVASGPSGGLEVVAPSTNTLLAEIYVFASDGWGIAYDALNGIVYATDPTTAFSPYDLVEMSGTTLAGYLPFPAQGIAYDAANHALYVGLSESGQFLAPLVPNVTVTDAATLSGTAPGAGGSVTYRYYSGASCAGSPTTVSTVTVTNGVVPGSSALTFPTDSESYEATYGGDGNDGPATSACEPLVPPARVGPPPTLSTNTLTTAVAGPANFVETDPSGHSAGFGNAGGAPNGYPNATLAGPPSPFELIAVGGPVSGVYTVQVSGLASVPPVGGRFTIDAVLRASHGTLVLNASYSGSLSAGEVETLHLTVGTSGISLVLVSTQGGPPSPAESRPWWTQPLGLGAIVAVIATIAAAGAILYFRAGAGGDGATGIRRMRDVPPPTNAGAAPPEGGGGSDPGPELGTYTRKKMPGRMTAGSIADPDGGASGAVPTSPAPLSAALAGGSAGAPEPARGTYSRKKLPGRMTSGSVASPSSGEGGSGPATAGAAMLGGGPSGPSDTALGTYTRKKMPGRMSSAEADPPEAPSEIAGVGQYTRKKMPGAAEAPAADPGASEGATGTYVRKKLPGRITDDAPPPSGSS